MEIEKKKYDIEWTNKVVRVDSLGLTAPNWAAVFEGINQKGERKRVYVLKVEDIEEEKGAN